MNCVNCGKSFPTDTHHVVGAFLIDNDEGTILAIAQTKIGHPDMERSEYTNFQHRTLRGCGPEFLPVMELPMLPTTMN